MTKWTLTAGRQRQRRRDCRLPSAVCRLFSAAQTFNLLGHHIRYLCYSCSFLSAVGCRLSLSASASACATRCSAAFLCAFEAFVLPLGMLYQRPQTTAATSLFACMQVAKFTKAQTHTHTLTSTLTQTYALTELRKLCSSSVISTWKKKYTIHIQNIYYVYVCVYIYTPYIWQHALLQDV